MPREKTFEAQTLEEAIRDAAEYLGIGEEAVHYTLLEEGRRGVLGFGAKPARISVELPEGHRPTRPPETPKPEPVAESEAGPPPPALLETVEGILRDGGFDLKAEIARGERGWTVRLEGPDEGLFLKRNAGVLRAFEFLLHRMARRSWPEAGPVRLECGGSGNGTDRDHDVAELAREIAGVVARTGRPRRLHPMNPYERRIVHVTVREFPGLVSRSEGEGFLKRITVERGSRRRPRRRR